jgi:integration host factor subunit beta
MKKVTRVDLVQALVARLDVRRTVAEAIVATVLGSLVRALQNREKVELRGLGSLRLRKRGPRVGRNPRKDGVKVAVPAKWVPYFKPGKELKALLNGATKKG